jgi:hypothetical protein
MKMHTLRYLVLPWFIFFVVAIGMTVSISIEKQMLITGQH